MVEFQAQVRARHAHALEAGTPPGYWELFGEVRNRFKADQAQISGGVVPPLQGVVVASTRPVAPGFQPNGIHSYRITCE